MIGALKRNACFASSRGVERLFSVLRGPWKTTICVFRVFRVFRVLRGP